MRLNMESIQCLIALPVGISALFFMFLGWRRGVRFNYHDYQGDRKERLRDNFFSSFAMTASLGCFFFVFSADFWDVVIPFYLLMVCVVKPIGMLGAYWSSLLTRAIAGDGIRPTRFSSLNGKNLSALEWYEFTPFVFVAGWIVCYLTYLFLR
jgi:hypothetical protein